MPAFLTYHSSAVHVPSPICPCCKRPDEAVLEQVANVDRLAPMWHCRHCNASWLHRTERKR